MSPSLEGLALPNHAYANLSLVGKEGSHSVRCHTDLDTCCSGAQGVHHGDWIPPGSDTRLPFSNDTSVGIYQVQGPLPQRVILRRRNNADMPSGIYRCDIPTNAVHDDNDISVRESVYVGLYATGGIIIVVRCHRRRNQWGTGGTCPPETFLAFKCSIAPVTAPMHSHSLHSKPDYVCRAQFPTHFAARSVPHVHMRMNASCLSRAYRVLTFALTQKSTGGLVPRLVRARGESGNKARSWQCSDSNNYISLAMSQKSLTAFFSTCSSIDSGDTETLEEGRYYMFCVLYNNCLCTQDMEMLVALCPTKVCHVPPPMDVM